MNHLDMTLYDLPTSRIRKMRSNGINSFFGSLDYQSNPIFSDLSFISLHKRGDR